MAKKAEEERLARQEQRNSKEAPIAAPVVTGTTTSAGDHDDLYRDPTPAATNAQESDPTSPTSPTASKGFKGIFGKLKRRSKHTSAGIFSSGDVGKEKEPGFVGGATLRSSASQSQAQSYTSPISATSEDEPPRNLGDIEAAYVPHVDEVDDTYSDVSSLSNYEEPRGRSAERLTTRATVASGGTDFEEAQDHFDEGLAPPPTFTTDADKATKGSPNRDSKFHEIGI